MIKNIKTGFKLMKYSYKCKVNVIMMILFTAIGLYLEIDSRGTNSLGGFYFMLLGLFAYQMIMSMDISSLVQSSAMKRKLQIDLPVFTSTILYLILYTFLVIERIILVKQNPQDKDQLMFTLFTVAVLLFTVYIFSSICYKYFVIAFIIYFATVMLIMMGINMLLEERIYSFVCNMGFTTLTILGYTIIIIGGALEYVIGCLLYRKPLSEFAFRGIFRDQK